MIMQNQQDVYVPQAISQGHHGTNTHGSNDIRVLQNFNLQGELLPSGAYGRQMNAASGKFSRKVQASPLVEMVSSRLSKTTPIFVMARN